MSRYPYNPNKYTCPRSPLLSLPPSRFQGDSQNLYSGREKRSVDIMRNDIQYNSTTTMILIQPKSFFYSFPVYSGKKPGAGLAQLLVIDWLMDWLTAQPGWGPGGGALSHQKQGLTHPQPHTHQHWFQTRSLCSLWQPPHISVQQTRTTALRPFLSCSHLVDREERKEEEIMLKLL